MKRVASSACSSKTAVTLELESKDMIDELAPECCRRSSRRRGPSEGKKARAIGAWLVESEHVVDFYLDDSALEEILAVW